MVLVLTVGKADDYKDQDFPAGKAADCKDQDFPAGKAVDRKGQDFPAGKAVDHKDQDFLVGKAGYYKGFVLPVDKVAVHKNLVYVADTDYYYFQTEYIHLVDTDFDCKDLRFRLIGNVVIVHTAIESSISLDVSTQVF